MRAVTHAKGHRYEYQKWSILHREVGKQRWCYLTKADLPRPEIKWAILGKSGATQKATQNVTQNCSRPNDRNLSSNFKTLFYNGGAARIWTGVTSARGS